MKRNIFSGVTTTEAHATGNSFNFSTYVDYALSKYLWLRASGSWEQLDINSKGSKICSEAECIAKASYVASTLTARYLVSAGNIRPWLGAGFTFLLPIRKQESNFLKLLLLPMSL